MPPGASGSACGAHENADGALISRCVPRKGTKPPCWACVPAFRRFKKHAPDGASLATPSKQRGPCPCSWPGLPGHPVHCGGGSGGGYGWLAAPSNISRPLAPLSLSFFVPVPSAPAFHDRPISPLPSRRRSFQSARRSRHSFPRFETHPLIHSFRFFFFFFFSRGRFPRSDEKYKNTKGFTLHIYKYTHMKGTGVTQPPPA